LLGEEIIQLALNPWRKYNPIKMTSLKLLTTVKVTNSDITNFYRSHKGNVTQMKDSD